MTHVFLWIFWCPTIDDKNNEIWACKSISRLECFNGEGCPACNLLGVPTKNHPTIAKWFNPDPNNIVLIWNQCTCVQVVFPQAFWVSIYLGQIFKPKNIPNIEIFMHLKPSPHGERSQQKVEFAKLQTSCIHLICRDCRPWIQQLQRGDKTWRASYLNNPTLEQVEILY